MAKYIPKRSGVAIAAQRRHATKMKHRNQPRGGSRNSQADLEDELEDLEDYDPSELDYRVHSP